MKKIKMFMGAVLCMNLLTLSGCDRIVQSAVVEEKGSDRTEKRREKGDSSENRCRTGTGTGNIPDNDPGRSKISGPGG